MPADNQVTCDAGHALPPNVKDRRLPLSPEMQHAVTVLYVEEVFAALLSGNCGLVQEQCPYGGFAWLCEGASQGFYIQKTVLFCGRGEGKMVLLFALK